MVSIGDLARLASVPGTDDLAPDCASDISVLADICEPRSEAVASA